VRVYKEEVKEESREHSKIDIGYKFLYHISASFSQQVARGGVEGAETREVDSSNPANLIGSLTPLNACKRII
jgi:hypothetical protein